MYFFYFFRVCFSSVTLVSVRLRTLLSCAKISVIVTKIGIGINLSSLYKWNYLGKQNANEFP